MQKISRPWNRAIRVGAATAFGCAGIYTYAAFGRNKGTAKPALNPASFVPFTLINRERVSETNSILTIRGSSSASGDDASEPIRALWRQGIWSIEIKQPQLMIARRYTPLPPPFFMDHLGSDKSIEFSASSSPTSRLTEDIALLVRREPLGEVSRYLHAIPIGAPVEIRGGYVEYKIPDDVKEVVFLAGGTGIAPALQVAKALQERGADARMKVLWANRTRDECEGGVDTGKIEVSTRGWTRWWYGRKSSRIDVSETTKNAIVQQLDALAQCKEGNEVTTPRLEFTARFFIDEEGSLLRQNDINRALKVNSSGSSDQLPSHRKLVIISGPDGFVEYLAGAKKLVNGIETQGPIGGLLSKANLQGWEVWKL